MEIGIKTENIIGRMRIRKPIGELTPTIIIIWDKFVPLVRQQHSI